MKFIDFLIAMVAPLFVPLFVWMLDNVQKPTVFRTNSTKTTNLEGNRVSLFLKELPTAYIGNAIWGMTYKINQNEQDIQWMIFYCFLALFCCLPIMYSRSFKKPWLYRIVTILIYVILTIIASERIFNIF
jgi:hypothetical protein